MERFPVDSRNLKARGEERGFEIIAVHTYLLCNSPKYQHFPSSLKNRSLPEII